MSNFWTWWTSPYPPNPSVYPSSQIKYWDKNQVEMLWGMLKNAGLSDNACAGLFGNLHWESGICPMKCEGLAIVDRSRNETINRGLSSSPKTMEEAQDILSRSGLTAVRVTIMIILTRPTGQRSGRGSRQNIK